LPDRRKIIEQLFARLSAREFGALEELLDDDAVFDVAYAPAGAGAAFPVRGATAIQAVFETGVATLFSRLDFEVLATYLGQDPGVIVVEYASSGVAAPTGRPYRNRYAGIFTIRDRKVALWREYHNPERMIEAFGNPSGSS
jgi:ketosteroid isomerase-like protein